ncbi:DUF58 domain-containing protein [Microbacterium tumbae]
MTPDAAPRGDVEASIRQTLRWRRTPAFAIGSMSALVLAGAGLLFSRPDVVALGLPLALWCAFTLFRPAHRSVGVALSAVAAEDAAVVTGRVDIDADADWVQLAIDQGGRRRGTADAGSGRGAVRTRTRLQHSGPVELIGVTARAVDGDGAWVSQPLSPVKAVWNAAPRPIELSGLPVGRRLRGLHGIHRGSRPGQGGEFRDIHAFAPGDELRRVDWRATARLGRRPGDLLVRRTDALSEASIVIAMDTADDLGAVVATWGTADPERSGITSLDLARQAALSIATTAIRAGDRVSFHELAPGGRTVLPGTGSRQLARLRSAVAATGVSGDATGFRRTPHMPNGSVIFVLSTFFDGTAARLAEQWQASGHRVVAIDVLPASDARRLTPEQRLALRALAVERANTTAALQHVGIDAVSWSQDGSDAAMRVAARVRR